MIVQPVPPLLARQAALLTILIIVAPTLSVQAFLAPFSRSCLAVPGFSSSSDPEGLRRDFSEKLQILTDGVRWALYSTPENQESKEDDRSIEEVEAAASKRVFNQLLFPQQIASAVTGAIFLFVIVGFLLNSFGYAYVSQVPTDMRTTTILVSHLLNFKLNRYITEHVYTGNFR
jgi:hypothetical protein